MNSYLIARSLVSSAYKSAGTLLIYQTVSSTVKVSLPSWYSWVATATTWLIGKVKTALAKVSISTIYSNLNVTCEGAIPSRPPARPPPLLLQTPKPDAGGIN